MEKLLAALGQAYMEKYGEDAEFENGETQAFLLNDCTVILEADESGLKINVAGGQPIKVDYTSGFFISKQEGE